MNLQQDKILELCQQLKLDGIQEEYTAICQRCAKEELSFIEELQKDLDTYLEKYNNERTH